jgi:hypothetical protein
MIRWLFLFAIVGLLALGANEVSHLVNGPPIPSHATPGANTPPRSCPATGTVQLPNGAWMCGFPP